MNDILTALSAFMPVKYVALGIALIPVIGRMYDSLRNGGGIRGVWRALYLGRSTDTPTAVAKDQAPIKSTDPNAKP